MNSIQALPATPQNAFLITADEGSSAITISTNTITLNDLKAEECQALGSYIANTVMARLGPQARANTLAKLIGKYDIYDARHVDILQDYQNSCRLAGMYMDESAWLLSPTE